MALFNSRQSYLETRIQLYDPEFDGPSSQSRRRKQNGMRNLAARVITSHGGFNLDLDDHNLIESDNMNALNQLYSTI
jgi:hypothetical protein